jgi:hypothetical protein
VKNLLNKIWWKTEYAIKIVWDKIPGWLIGLVLFLILIGSMWYVIIYPTSINPQPIPTSWSGKRVYVMVGNKYTVFSENTYGMHLNYGALFIYRNSDNKLVMVTSNWTEIIDDTLDPNADVVESPK